MNIRPRQLRRNASDAENRLWYVLPNRGVGGYKFVRQMAVGPYIADFACREAALIVELDGGSMLRMQRTKRARPSSIPRVILFSGSGTTKC